MAGGIDKVYTVFRPLKGYCGRRDGDTSRTFLGKIVSYSRAIIDFWPINADSGLNVPPGFGI